MLDNLSHVPSVHVATRLLKMCNSGDTIHQELEPLTRIHCADLRKTRQF